MRAILRLTTITGLSLLLGQHTGAQTISGPPYLPSLMAAQFGATSTSVLQADGTTWRSRLAVPRIGFNVSDPDTQAWIIGSTDSSSTKFRITNSASFGTNDMLVIDGTTDSVGIGTGSPTAKLHIIDTSSFQVGLRVSQTAPATGTVAGPLQLNNITTQFFSEVTGGNSATVSALHAQLSVGTTNLIAKELFGGSFSVIQTSDDTSDSDKVGLSGAVASNFTSPGKIYGGSTDVSMSAGSSPQILGWEADFHLTGTSSTTARGGFNAWNGGTVAGTDFDAAYVVSNSGDAGATGYWKNFLALYAHGSAVPPMDPTGNFFMSDAAQTINNIFDAGNITVTGNILEFPNVHMTGSGMISLGTVTPPTSRIDINTGLSSSSWTTGGIAFRSRGTTYADTTGAGTIATRVVNSFGAPILAANNLETLTNAVTVYIAGPPTAGNKTTITNPWSLYVASGNIGFVGLPSSGSGGGQQLCSDTAGLLYKAVCTPTAVTTFLPLATAASATVAAGNTGGTNYAVSDTITLAGGTCSVHPVLTVATLSGSSVATATVTTPGQCTVLPSAPTAQSASSGAGTGATFQVTWTAVGQTYTPTTGMTTADVYAMGAGGSGGGGALQALNNAASGGAGGGGGACMLGSFTAAQIGVSKTVTIGLPGLQGAPATSSTNAGGNGAAGGNTSFGTLAIGFGGGGGAGGQLAAASGGGGGGGFSAGGSSTNSTGGTSGAGGATAGGAGAVGGTPSNYYAGAGGNGGTAAGAAVNGSAGGAGVGGASGGGLSSTSVTTSGGNGGAQRSLGETIAGASGGAVNTSGDPGGNPSTVQFCAGGGSGGGGGGSAATTTTAGSGGTGGNGSGGGGGGSTVDGAGSVAGWGGLGGAGYLTVVEHF